MSADPHHLPVFSTPTTHSIPSTIRVHPSKHRHASTPSDNPKPEDMLHDPPPGLALKQSELFQCSVPQVDPNEAPSTPDPDDDFFRQAEDIPPSPPSTSSPYQSAPHSTPSSPHPAPLSLSNYIARPQTPPLPAAPCHAECSLTLVQDLSRFVPFVQADSHSARGLPITINQPKFHQRGLKDKWYYISKGTAVGIWNSWYVVLLWPLITFLNLIRTEAGSHVLGIRGSIYQSTTTEVAAYEGFLRAICEDQVILLGSSHEK